LLADQNSRSFSYEPHFDQVTIKNLKKIGLFLSDHHHPFSDPKNQGVLAIILLNKVGIGNVIPRWARNLIPNRLAFNSRNFNFSPILANSAIKMHYQLSIV